MQLCGSLSILWHCLSLGLEWKLTFSSPVATAVFSKFAGMLSTTLSQHHLLGWVITRSWLSGSWRSFLYNSSVYSCCLLLISSASIRSIPFLCFIEPIFEWNVPLVSLIFLKTSLVFPLLLFSSICIDRWERLSYLSLLFFGTLLSDAYIFPFLLCFSLVFFSQLFVRPPQTATLPFCISFLGDSLDPCLLYNVTNLCP